MFISPDCTLDYQKNRIFSIVYRYIMFNHSHWEFSFIIIIISNFVVFYEQNPRGVPLGFCSFNLCRALNISTHVFVFLWKKVEFRCYQKVKRLHRVLLDLLRPLRKSTLIHNRLTIHNIPFNWFELKKKKQSIFHIFSLDQ